MRPLANRKILLGITGSIAAYKAAVLTRRLVEAGAEVQVVMTDSAQRFITPMTLAALSGHAVRDSLWDEAAELSMGHIELARWADLIVIAPASADTLARLAHGRANDLLSTLCLASEAEVLVAPAMNHVMWAHPATRHNVETLGARGVQFVGPAEGELAERESGAGRMVEPEAIRDAVVAYFADAPVSGALAGRHVVITAGPTREALDPVRFITNHSSGRMGYALASACAAAGASVTLVSGPTALAVPAGVERVDVQSAADMHAAVFDVIETADIFIGAAAVADYRPATTAADKIKKAEGDTSLALTRTRDIIADVARDYPQLFTLGFAAETTDMENSARSKRERKHLSMVAGNVVGPEHAFGRDDNALFVVWEGGEQELAQASKAALAEQLVALVAERLPVAESNIES
ncbi:bifunctional phosphopantothenoylcysteine decarboxylase/phosphopantothenate--cysteine ligase CoaBC [Endozoicomonas sp. G2_2]|uniref:bifunctional phosphopantothenoylcysteine decarboxylase/phosphopantothenate--cysteine ligase CoaBC n=1 Tax=Endozoicomonas sp. G2_2 TaxID=2821092 RepID=UPI001ADC2E67|nr:bifunctional phosphopantothenoylcysteine decarboxylase/phosphopantothenate--cysteine ligase CoaBC [Endozoicomonas sp. G2_2]MBO9469495.1 bifunctional phosphopantothenoylcysteine decarboxylase/phosphopantothenate--cysteine ligase CoaBC [Endozoicomonas sp. G2_2]